MLKDRKDDHFQWGNLDAWVIARTSLIHIDICV